MDVLNLNVSKSGTCIQEWLLIDYRQLKSLPLTCCKEQRPHLNAQYSTYKDIPCLTLNFISTKFTRLYPWTLSWIIFFLLTSINHISRGFIFMLSFCLCQRSLQVFQHISCMNFCTYLICAWDLNSPSCPWFYTPNNIYWRAETMKFPYLHFFGPSIFTCILSVSQLYLP